MRNIGYELPPVVHHDILGWLDVCMHINHAWHDGHSRHVTYDRILRRIYYRARTDICYPAISNNYRSIINDLGARSEEHTSELQSLMRISYAVFCLKKKNNQNSKHISSLNNKKSHQNRTEHQH